MDCALNPEKHIEAPGNSFLFTPCTSALATLQNHTTEAWSQSHVAVPTTTDRKWDVFHVLDIENWHSKYMNIPGIFSTEECFLISLLHYEFISISLRLSLRLFLLALTHFFYYYFALSLHLKSTCVYYPHKRTFLEEINNIIFPFKRLHSAGVLLAFTNIFFIKSH